MASATFSSYTPQLPSQPARQLKALTRMETLERLIPKIRFRHAHDPSHAPDHMISSIVGASLTLPVIGGTLHLGTWQRVLLVECNGPRRRTLVVTWQ